MAIIAPTTSISARPHYVQLQRPTDPVVPDGDGSYTEEPWTNLDPPFVFARVAPATAHNLERLAPMSTSVLAQATHVVTMPYHPQLTTKCQILFNGRTLQITGVASPEELGVETIAVCQEIVA